MRYKRIKYPFLCTFTIPIQMFYFTIPIEIVYAGLTKTLVSFSCGNLNLFCPLRRGAMRAVPDFSSCAGAVWSPK